MKKLKVKVGYGVWEKMGFIEGAVGTMIMSSVLVYFPVTQSLEVVELSKVTPIGYEEV